jgi:hypothetical protein
MYIADPRASVDRLLAAIEGRADGSDPKALVTNRLGALVHGPDAARACRCVT